MKKFLFVLLGVFVVMGAFAAGENVPTSKSYVDSKLVEKQDIIQKNDGATQVLTNTGTAGEYGTKGIYNANGAYATQTQNLVDAATMNAGVQNAIDSEFQCIEWVDPNDHTSDCLLMNIFGQTEQQSPNLFPSPANQTATQNSITVTIENGIYNLSGVANANTCFDFELPITYTPKPSVGSSGTGVMYLWNNKIFGSGSYNPSGNNTVSVAWLRQNKNVIDGWRFLALNRKSWSYATQTGGNIAYVRICIDNGVDVNNFTFAPMFVEDGITTYDKFYPYGNLYLPAGN